MDINTYSQVGQDLWVLSMLGGLRGGFFLDVGAFDGIHYSNTYLLEREYGWFGLCVEPNPDLVKLLEKNRISTIADVALSDISGEVSFKPDGLSGQIYEEGYLRVQAMTFMDLLTSYKVPNIIDYMSLDIEGHESLALSKFPFSEYKCRLITVEHNLYLGRPENKLSIYKTLSENGYTRLVEDVKHNGFAFEDWYVLNE